jgi:hypothetical protein
MRDMCEFFAAAAAKLVEVKVARARNTGAG